MGDPVEYRTDWSCNILLPNGKKQLFEHKAEVEETPVLPTEAAPAEMADGAETTVAASQSATAGQAEPATTTPAAEGTEVLEGHQTGEDIQASEIQALEAAGKPPKELPGEVTEASGGISKKAVEAAEKADLDADPTGVQFVEDATEAIAVPLAGSIDEKDVAVR